MTNPFGLPRAILAEREARRRRRFQFGVYAVLIVTTVLLLGTLIQGCQSRRQKPVKIIAEKPVSMADSNTTNLTTLTKSLPPVPEPVPEQSMETNCINPGSANLPENITLPESGATPTPHVISTRSPSLVKELRKAPPVHHLTGEYVVKSRDTLVRIAKVHGTTVKAWKTANRLNSDPIFAGEKLKIPPACFAVAEASQN